MCPKAVLYPHFQARVGFSYPTAYVMLQCTLSPARSTTAFKLEHEHGPLPAMEGFRGEPGLAVAVSCQP